ncbi:hypothetical protein ABIC83_002592 [Roseateles asaccharophilus]|uniref:hypothetical protein n=1 Tax=Roseateles asaccharophilus TaxID=582607 RepID=UPI003833F77A
MSSAQPTCSGRPNLLQADAASKAPAPFDGEQRKKALALLASSIAEHKAVSVMQLVNRDPSLAAEILDMPVSAVSAQTVPVEFPLACLRAGISAGYVFAISRGFPVDKLLQNGTTNLLQAAISHRAGDRTTEADVSLLLSMGADPAAMPSQDALYTAVASAFPHKEEVIHPEVVSMLLDAKANFSYDSKTLCPASVLVRSGRWNKEEGAHEMTKLLAKIKRSGVDLDRKTGSPLLTPLQRAVAMKSGRAIMALIRVGAKSGPEQLGGKDLFQVLESAGLQVIVPEVQAALMESQISRSTAGVDLPQVTASAAPANPRSRRIGAI